MEEWQRCSCYVRKTDGDSYIFLAGFPTIYSSCLFQNLSLLICISCGALPLKRSVITADLNVCKWCCSHDLMFQHDYVRGEWIWSCPSRDCTLKTQSWGCLEERGSIERIRLIQEIENYTWYIKRKRSIKECILSKFTEIRWNWGAKGIFTLEEGKRGTEVSWKCKKVSWILYCQKILSIQSEKIKLFHKRFKQRCREKGRFDSNRWWKTKVGEFLKSENI